MRPMSWQHILAGVVVLGMIVGVFVYEKRMPSKKSPKEVISTETAKPAAKTATTRTTQDSTSKVAEKSATAPTAPAAPVGDNFNLNEKIPADGKVTQAIAPIITHTLDGVIGTPGIGHGSGCTAAEYRGTALEKTRIEGKDWKKAMDLFHDLKKVYSTWLREHRTMFKPEVAKEMNRIIQEIKIQRAPTPELPDLSWRGIALFGKDHNNEPIIRIGGGFVHLLKNSPGRARFELARLMAQAWAPCELIKADAHNAWNSLFQCLEVNETMACQDGTFSEGAWALSSALGSVLSPPPGCLLPVFKTEKYMACLSPLRPAGKEHRQ